MGQAAATAARDRGGKRGPPSRLPQQIAAVAQLPKARRQVVSEMSETVLGQGLS